MKEQTTIIDPAMPTNPPGWREFDTTTDNGDTIEVSFKLPFPAMIESGNAPKSTLIYRDATIKFQIPVGKFAIFTEQCTRSTIERLGKRDARELFSQLAKSYYGKLILAEMFKSAEMD